MIVYVVIEVDFDDETIIGVADDIDYTHDMINKYFGQSETLFINEVNEGGIEYVKDVEYIGHNNEKHKSIVRVEYYEINEV